MNLINGDLELWVYTGNKNNYNKTIIAVSNRGRIKTKDGNIRYSKYRKRFSINGVGEYIYRFLATNFIHKTEEDIRLGRDEVDHITHKPDGMNINDVRNLRWCTHAENMGFPEARTNFSKAQKGKPRKPFSDFGKKFFEQFGITNIDNPKLYNREKLWYYKHNHKCSWE